MLSRISDSFLLSDLKDIDPASNSWFSEDSTTALAGRCLLDAYEYLRVIPQFPGRFREVTNAHTVRLVCRSLSDQDLACDDPHLPTVSGDERHAARRASDHL
jgi:hypothetical protein